MGVVLPTSVSYAEPSIEDEERVSALISDLTPDHAVTLDPAVSSGTAVVESDDVQFAIPLDADDEIGITDDTGETLALKLPAELNLDDGKVASDGTIVYQSNDGKGEAAVQALADGTLRVQTIIPNGEAPHEFTYSWGEDVTPIKNDDGSIDLLSADSSGRDVIVGHVASPWAVDANGSPVDTEYVVNETDAVQVVMPTADTAYPVVADPTFGHSWGIPTMYLNWSETKSARNAGAAAFICAGAGPLAFICGANIAIIMRGANIAVDRGQCVKYLISPVSFGPQYYNC